MIIIGIRGVWQLFSTCSSKAPSESAILKVKVISFFYQGPAACNGIWIFPVFVLVCFSCNHNGGPEGYVHAIQGHQKPV